MGCKEELQVCLLARLNLMVCLFVVLAGHVGFARVLAVLEDMLAMKKLEALASVLASHVGFAGVLAAIEDMLVMKKLLV